MKKPFKIGLLFLISMLFFTMLPTGVCQAASASVTVNGGNAINIGSGQSDSASITIGSISGFTSGNGIGGFTFIATWDPSVINVTSIDEGSLPSGWSLTPGNISGGSVKISGYGTTTPITDTTTVASLQFTATGSPGASTTINISVESLGDIQTGTPVSATTAGSTITILQQHTLTMATVGQGSTSPSVGNHAYNEGQTVSISANPSNGWRFDHWEGDAANPNSASTSVTINSDKTITAVFVQIPTYTLSIAINGEGSVDPAPGNYTIRENETVGLSATPAEGWRFIGWTGGVSSPDSATTTVVMDGNKNIIANFAPRDSFALTVNIEGSGSTTPQEGTHTYSRDAEVEVTANPAQGYKFDSWIGDVSDPNSATTTVVIDDDKEITARFVEIPAYTLTIEVSGNGTTEPAPGAYQYLEGTEVNITATPADGHRFSSWTGNVGDTDSMATTITITADTTVTANFVEGPPPPPQFTNIDVLLTTRNEAVITWNTDLPAAGKVIYWEEGNSQKETPLETDISTRHVVLLEELEPGKTYNYSILVVDDYGNEVTSPQNSFATVYTEAAFKITGWNSDIAIEEDGRQVTINVTVANSGDLPGGYELVLKINGTTKESRTVNLEPGGTETATFNVLLETAGNYSLDVNGFTLGLEIPETAEKPTVTTTTPHPGQIDPDSPGLKDWLKANWQIVFGVVMGIILLILIIILILHRYYYIVTFIRR